MCHVWSMWCPQTPGGRLGHSVVGPLGPSVPSCCLSPGYGDLEGTDPTIVHSSRPGCALGRMALAEVHGFTWRAGALCQQPGPGPGRWTAGVVIAGGREAMEPALTAKAKERLESAGAARGLASHKGRLYRGPGGERAGWVVRLTRAWGKNRGPGARSQHGLCVPWLFRVCALPEGPGVPENTAEEGSSPDFPLWCEGAGGCSHVALYGSEGVPHWRVWVSGHWGV